jgi:hypothetical protein
MTNQSYTSQLKPIFLFPLQDRQSKERFLIGSALTLAGLFVPILPGLIVTGYVLRVLRSTARGEAPSMEAWADWSGLLSLGGRGWVVQFVFTLPALVFFIVGMAAYFGMFVMIPFTAAAESDAVGPIFGLMFLGMAAMFISLAAGFLFLILGLIPLPAALAHFVVKEDLGAAFRWREWRPILSANKLGYFISFVIVMGIFGIMYSAALVLYYTFVLIFLAYIIMIPLSFYALLVAAAFFGDNYREGLAALPQEAAQENVVSG